jgi:hypothetical protein
MEQTREGYRFGRLKTGSFGIWVSVSPLAPIQQSQVILRGDHFPMIQPGGRADAASTDGCARR